MTEEAITRCSGTSRMQQHLVSNSIFATEFSFSNAGHGELAAAAPFCMRKTDWPATWRISDTAAGTIVRDERNLIAYRSTELHESRFHPFEAKNGRDLKRSIGELR